MKPSRGEHFGPLISAGILLGSGLGGFVDGIVLHQLLQWHNMLSSVLPPTNLVDMKINMFWDGVFHSLVWVLCVLGLTVLFRAARRPDVPWSASAFVGSLCGGWGLFNFVEGIIDHQLLNLHHVHPGPTQLAWDLGFIALGLLQMVVGVFLVRREMRQTGAQSAVLGASGSPRRQ